MLLPAEYLRRFKAIGEHQFCDCRRWKLVATIPTIEREGILAARSESRFRVPEADNKSATFTRDPTDMW